MLMPSPEIQKRLDKYQTYNPEEAKAIKLEQRRLKRRARLYGATVLTLLMGAHVSAYAADVHNNQELQASSDPYISVLGDPIDTSNDDNALVFMNGFGSGDADILTKYMSRAIQPVVDGQLWSVNYNDAPLNYSTIADQIIATADTQGVDSVSLVGYSAGGSISMQVEEQISEKSSLRINSIFLISTPDGAKGLRPARQDEVELVEKAKLVPGAEYSSYIRYIGEMAFRAGNYTSDDNFFNNVNDFFETSHDVQEAMKERKLPGTWLMFDQVLAIENANIGDRINNIDKLPDARVRPTVIYVGTAKPGYDYMVNNEKSSQDIGADAAKANLPYFVLNVPGAVHTRPDLANEAYIKTLAAAKQEIQESIDEQTSIAYQNLLTERFKHLKAPTPSVADLSANAPQSTPPASPESQ